MTFALPLADLGDSLDSFLNSTDKFFTNLADVNWVALLVALPFFGIYLTIRSRAYFNVLRAAYPDAQFQWRKIWGAYVASYGFNNVVPARGGDLIKLFLVKNTIPHASYPAVASSMFVELIFDATMGTLILAFAFTQGVFPKPPDFAKLHAFDLSYFAAHPQFTLFLLTAIGIAIVVGFALLSARVKAFWSRVRQGLAILGDRRRFFREVYLVQFVGWLFRCTAFWFLLEAFHIGGSVRNVLLVLGVQAISAAVPFTPGGAGVQQALLLQVFAGTASAATVAAYSVGQQAAIAVFSFALGFAALVVIFRFRSFKEVIHLGRQEREAEKAAKKNVAT